MVKTIIRLWGRRGYLPRSDTLILVIGLLCLVIGKSIMVLQEAPVHLFSSLVLVIYPDVLFFAGVYVLLQCLFIIGRNGHVGRVALIIASGATIWSLLNVVWMFASGVQLHPAVLLILLKDLLNQWPLVQDYLITRLGLLLGVFLFILGLSGLFCWLLMRPGKIRVAQRILIKRAGLMLICFVILYLAHIPASARNNVGFIGDALGYSSHWQALRLPFYNTNRVLIEPGNRVIPSAGQRQVAVPAGDDRSWPNIVIVYLESVPYQETSLADSKLETTPCLSRLAAEGVEFRRTYTVVPRTTKALWTGLTGSYPAAEDSHVEAVPADQPYESLVTILGRVGYRCGFFEMSRGAFECAPGFFKNLGFDWAWFRENSKDPSAYLGYLGGDDCQMLEPAFTWAKDQDGPCLLAMISTVSHYPFDVPSWYGQPLDDDYANYQQSLRYTDHFLQEIYNYMQDCHVDRNTILCVVGDHGITFRQEFGNIARWVPSEDMIRVPWILRWPGHLEAGRKIDALCSQLDITPTLLSLLGFDVSRAGFDGVNALDEVRGDRRLYFSAPYVGSPCGFIESNKKYVYWPELEQVVRYNLATDAQEKYPLPVSIEQESRVEEEIRSWQQGTRFTFEPTRFREEVVYSYWKTYSSGSYARAEYLPNSY